MQRPALPSSLPRCSILERPRQSILGPPQPGVIEDEMYDLIELLVVLAIHGQNGVQIGYELLSHVLVLKFHHVPIVSLRTRRSNSAVCRLVCAADIRLAVSSPLSVAKAATTINWTKPVSHSVRLVDFWTGCPIPFSSTPQGRCGSTAPPSGARPLI